MNEKLNSQFCFDKRFLLPSTRGKNRQCDMGRKRKRLKSESTIRAPCPLFFGPALLELLVIKQFQNSNQQGKRPWALH